MKKSTLSRQGSHARTLVAPGKKDTQPIHVLDSGQRRCDWFASLDLPSYSWKTLQGCLFEGLEKYSGAWPRSGMMRNGNVYHTAPLVDSNYVTGSGYWPTLKASDGDQYSSNRGYFLRRLKIAPDLPVIVALSTPPTPEGYYGKLNPVFAEWLMGYPQDWTDCEGLETPLFRKLLK